MLGQELAGQTQTENRTWQPRPIHDIFRVPA